MTAIAHVAAVHLSGYHLTRLGHEETLTVNHLAPQLLTMRLLFNLLFAFELRRRHPELRVVALDPGFVRTKLGRHATGAFRLLLRATAPMQTAPATPARDLADALDDTVTGVVGRNLRPITSSVLSADPATAGRLWDESIRLLARIQS